MPGTGLSIEHRPSTASAPPDPAPDTNRPLESTFLPPIQLRLSGAEPTPEGLSVRVARRQTSETNFRRRRGEFRGWSTTRHRKGRPQYRRQLGRHSNQGDPLVLPVLARAGSRTTLLLKWSRHERRGGGRTWPGRPGTPRHHRCGPLQLAPRITRERCTDPRARSRSEPAERREAVVGVTYRASARYPC